MDNLHEEQIKFTTYAFLTQFKLHSQTIEKGVYIVHGTARFKGTSDLTR